MLVNGVHIVPGRRQVDPELPLFTYVLTVAGPQEHRGRFIQRFLDR